VHAVERRVQLLRERQQRVRGGRLDGAGHEDILAGSTPCFEHVFDPVDVGSESALGRLRGARTRLVDAVWSVRVETRASPRA
jgi:hypothetical protein